MPLTLKEFRGQYTQYDDLSDDDLARSLHTKFYPDVPFDVFSKEIKLEPAEGDISRGFKRSFAQLPELAYGAGALASLSAEKIFGEGGLSTSAKNYFSEKFHAKQTENQKYAPTVEFTGAWDSLKSGDYSPMADWLQDSAAYTVGQGLQTIATGGLGALAGKAVLKTSTQKLLGGMVAKSADKIMGEAVKTGAKMTIEEATKMAAGNIASGVGAFVALNAQNLGMEAGDIYGGLTEQAKKDKREITGDDLWRAWGMAGSAALTETVTDLFGLGALTGRIKIGNKTIQEMTGAAGRAARGAVAAGIGVPVEGGQEYVQTYLEQVGAGRPTDTEEARKERINAGMVGAMGGVVMGGGIGVVTPPVKAVSAPIADVELDAQADKRAVETVMSQPTLDAAVAATEAAISAPRPTPAALQPPAQPRMRVPPAVAALGAQSRPQPSAAAILETAPVAAIRREPAAPFAPPAITPSTVQTVIAQPPATAPTAQTETSMRAAFKKVRQRIENIAPEAPIQPIQTVVVPVAPAAPPAVVQPVAAPIAPPSAAAPMTAPIATAPVAIQQARQMTPASTSMAATSAGQIRQEVTPTTNELPTKHELVVQPPLRESVPVLTKETANAGTVRSDQGRPDTARAERRQQAEYEGGKGERGQNIQREQEAGREAGYRKASEAWWDGLTIEQRQEAAKNAGLRTAKGTPNSIAKSMARRKWSEIATRVRATLMWKSWPDMPSPWKLTVLEFARSYEPEVTAASGNIKAQHHKEVKAAVGRGESVPPEVLAAYPELAKMITKKVTKPAKPAQDEEKTLSDDKSVRKRASVAGQAQPVVDKAAAPAEKPAAKNEVATAMEIGAIKTKETETGTSMFSRRSAAIDRDRTNIETATRRMSKFVDAFVAGELKDWHTQILGRTPTVLRALGADDLPLRIDGATVRKVLVGKHRYFMSADLLKQVPESLYDPLVVFNSPGNNGEPGKLIITRLADKYGNPVVAAIHLNKTGMLHRINDIASIYGMENPEKRFTEETKKGRLEYVKNEESLAPDFVSPHLNTSPVDVARGQSITPSAISSLNTSLAGMVQLARSLGNKILTETDIVKEYGPQYSRKTISRPSDMPWKDLVAAANSGDKAAKQEMERQLAHELDQGVPSGQRTGEISFSRRTETAPLWYSQMSRAIERLMAPAEPAGQIRLKIAAWARKGEFKQDEYDWSGIDQWLADQKGKITKEQVLDFLRANQVDVRQGQPLFRRGERNLPDNFPTNEANRDKTNRLAERILVTTGQRFTITPVAVPDDVADRNRAGRADEGTAPANDFRLAETLAGVFGKEVIQVRADGPFAINGVAVPGGSLSKYVFIDVRADHPAHAVLGHELSHHMEADAPEVYRELRETIEPLLKDHPKYRMLSGMPPGARHNAIVKEMIGDLMGDAFTDNALWRMVGQENPGLLRRIADVVVKWIDALLSKITKRGLGSEQFVTDLQAARSAIAQAVARYAGERDPTVFGDVQAALASRDDLGRFLNGLGIDIETLDNATVEWLLQGLEDEKASGTFFQMSQLAQEQLNLERYAKQQELDLVIGMKTQDGRIISGKKGQSHFHLLRTYPEEFVREGEFFQPQLGFVDKNGKFYTRGEAMQQVGITDSRYLLPGAEQPQFSRRVVRNATLSRAMDVLDNFTDSTKSFGFFKNINTQLHKARNDPEHFGKVFSLAMDFRTTLSRSAYRAWEHANGILPAYDDMPAAARAILRGKAASQELERVSTWVFDGTTYGGGNPLAGIRWTDNQLLTKFDATDKEVDLYHQARDAIDASLTEVANSVAWKLARPYISGAVKIDVINTPETAQESLLDALGWARSVADENTVALIEAAIASIEALYEQADNLKAAGYAPLSRFGRYTVDVFKAGADSKIARDVDGIAQRLEFQKFDFESEVRAEEKRLRREYAGQPDIVIKRGIQADTRLFSGVDPETVALFVEQVAGIPGLDIKREVLNEWRREAISQRSAIMRNIKRKGVAGYSRDLPRVLATFLTSNARYASSNFHMADMQEAINNIPDTKGDVKDEATELYNYINSSNEPGAWMRGIMFAWYLGGSPAAALVNITQPVTMTLPYLSQYGNAGRYLASSLRQAIKPSLIPIWLRSAMNRAMEEGLVEANEVHHLYDEGMKPILARLPGGEDLRARAQGAATLWGALFGMAENFNRRITFLAAYKMAQDMGAAKLREAGFDDSFAFAKKAIEETQGIYSKENRPNWARGTGKLGAVGVAAFTFRQFTIMYIELLVRMYRSGPQGKMATGLMLGILILASGIQGAPGSDDLDDLIDTVLQSLGYRGNSKKAKRDALKKMVGERMADIVMYGLSAETPIDIQTRLGMGNLFPATGVFKQSEKNKASQFAELLGPPGGLAKSVGGFIEAVQSGQRGSAFAAFAPVFIRNIAKAVQMAETGEYKDSRGRKVEKVDIGDAIIKGVGFQPQNVASQSRKAQLVRQDISQVREVESDITSIWAQGIHEKDKNEISRAREMLREWNEKNPETPIRINSAQIARRIKEMKKEQSDRIAKTAPKEMRRYVNDTLE